MSEVTFETVYPDGYKTCKTIPYDEAMELVAIGDRLLFETEEFNNLSVNPVCQLEIIYTYWIGLTKTDDGMFQFTVNDNDRNYQLKRITHKVKDIKPPTTGLYFDREWNRVWFDNFHEYYALIADNVNDYMVGSEYTPKPPFIPIITATEINEKEQEEQS